MTFKWRDIFMSSSENMSTATNIDCYVGAATGGLAGAGVLIWTSLEYIKPALENVDGISSIYAYYITIGIDFVAGIPAIFIGAVSGMVASRYCSLYVDDAVSCVRNINNRFRSSRNGRNFEAGVFYSRSQADNDHVASDPVSDIPDQNSTLERPPSPYDEISLSEAPSPSYSEALGMNHPSR